MVTSVSSAGQTDYLSVTNNIQKTSIKNEIASATLKNNIEDIYTSSFDITGTGVEFYANIIEKQSFMGALDGYSCGLCLKSGPDSLDSFKDYIKGLTFQDYNKQNPDKNISFFGSVNNEPESVKKYLANIDYEKEYAEYKQSRGCSTDEELKILSASPFQTKDQLIGHSAMLALSTVLSMQDKGFTSRSFEGVNFNELFKNLDLKDVANYSDSVNKKENYQQGVFAFQALCNIISHQKNIAEDVRGLFAGYSEDINDSKDEIKKFSDKIEADNKTKEMQQKYTASLIANYV